MEEQYYTDRTYLRQLLKQHPGWTIQQDMEATGRSRSWVKKWRQRLRQVPPEDHTVLQGFSRARKTPPESIHPDVIRRILEIRDNPPHQLRHVPGPKAIIYDLHQDTEFRASGRHLVDGGHRQIAMIKGPPGRKSVHARSEGFLLELELDGLSPNDRLVSEGDWSYSSGYRAMGQLLSGGEPFSALFVHNDQMAIGAMRALREAGKRIPDDVAIVGYDDIPAAEYTEPPLTTVRQPMREVGTVAARLLIQKIEQEDQTNQVMLLEPKLVQGGT